ncbi:truncated hemoglobin YjbI [Weissella uvarum]|uniref:hypothetical protein n=1 Tax=Weissella uvarum TaxID=1479233 RepID=UPI0019611CE6|nr:hypothetical protein [Weissella uvarum]MBM7617363.1 truncated hemoglobin YjbI [Weissella uvarum]MCM0595750.1 hypothetical protein [Weissella uvarum]
MAENTNTQRAIKALQASQEHADQVVSSMKGLDKDTLYAGVNELKTLIEEDPQLEKVFSDDLKKLRNNLRFISQASGIVKNAGNVNQATQSAVSSIKRFVK